MDHPYDEKDYQGVYRPEEITNPQLEAIELAKPLDQRIKEQKAAIQKHLAQKVGDDPNDQDMHQLILEGLRERLEELESQQEALEKN